MAKAITRIYDHFTDARTVVQGLKSAGISDDTISVMVADDHPEADDLDTLRTSDIQTGTATGAGIGGALGGGAGLLAGLGMMAIPGLGPVVAAGWLASTAAGAVAGAVAGAAAGGIVDALTDSGVPNDEAQAYAEAVRRGAILVSVRPGEADEDRVRSIMDMHRPADLAQRRETWRGEGWTGYNGEAPLDRKEMAAERDRWTRRGPAGESAGAGKASTGVIATGMGTAAAGNTVGLGAGTGLAGPGAAETGTTARPGAGITGSRQLP
jgi:hypothetical protein